MYMSRTHRFALIAQLLIPSASNNGGCSYRGLGVAVVLLQRAAPLRLHQGHILVTQAEDLRSRFQKWSQPSLVRQESIRLASVTLSWMLARTLKRLLWLGSSPLQIPQLWLSQMCQGGSHSVLALSETSGRTLSPAPAHAGYRSHQIQASVLVLALYRRA